MSLSDDIRIEMTPEYFYIVPGYMRFSTSAVKPFDQFFIHFNLSNRQKTLDNIYKFQVEEKHLEIINNFIAREQNAAI